MANQKWTIEQLRAIYHGGGNLLVAAGAGSGKTSVLVERVLRLIGARSGLEHGGLAYGSQEHGSQEHVGQEHVGSDYVGLDRLLIVTFTTAAASEMKERIAAALSDTLDTAEATEPAEATAPAEATEPAVTAVPAEPTKTAYPVVDSSYLRRQLMLLDNASISTLHSFCLKVIKDNIGSIDGLDSNFRLLDEAEASLLQADAMDDVLENRYADADNKVFADLVESYGMGRDDHRVAEIVQRTYKFSQSAPWPAEWLEQMVDLFRVETEDDFNKSTWFKYVVGMLSDELSSLIVVLRSYGGAVLECIKNASVRENASRVIDDIMRFHDKCSGVLSSCPPAADAQTAGEQTGGAHAAYSLAGDAHAAYSLAGGVDCANGAIIEWSDFRTTALNLGDMACLCPRAAKGESAERKIAREAVKNAVKDFIGMFVYRFFRLELADIIDEFSRSYILLRELASIVNEYSQRYADLKRARSVVDYNDLEHFAINILLDRGDTNNQMRFSPSETANVYRAKFAEVLVDEYQDINLVQEYIISAVSGGSVFMVGDVKQSIYRFRQAMPEIFLNKYLSYRNNNFVAEHPGFVFSGIPESPHGEKILLYKNFRSDQLILDFVNMIFGAIMSKKAGELDYSEAEWLLPGKSEEENPPGEVEVHIISKKAPIKKKNTGISGADSDFTSGSVEMASNDAASNDAASNDAASNDAASNDASRSDAANSDETGSDAVNSDEEGNDTSIQDDVSTAELEARFVAYKIKKMMMNDHALSFGDIAVLMRATKDTAPAFRDELIRLGIPAFTESGSTYFEKYEISVMISLLKIIDNPLQDIPLFTVMLSPIFSFTPEEAVLMRNAGENAGAALASAHAGGDNAGAAPAAAHEHRAGAHMTLYECLSKTAENTFENCNSELSEDTINKARSAIAALEKWRKVSIEKPVSALLWELMHVTGFYLKICAMPGAEQRRANLLKLFEYARIYEKISYKGIFNFLRFIDKMIEQGDDLGEANLYGENADSVRIMSIHKSKGLQFPVVFLAGCGKSFNLRDTAGQLLLHREAGFGPNFVDLKRRIIDDTIAKKVISKIIRNESLSEEMRILYVALTRAENKLYLIGTLADVDRYTQKLDNILAPYREFAGCGAKFSSELALSADKYLFWILSAMGDDSKFPLYTYSAQEFAGDEQPQNSTVESQPAPVAPEAAKAIGAPEASESPLQPPPPSPQPQLPPSPQSLPQLPPLTQPPPQPPLPDGFIDALDARLKWEYPYEQLSSIPRKVTVTDIVESRTTARLYIDEMNDDYTVELTNDSSDYYDKLLAKPKFMSGARDFSRAQIGTFTHTVLEKADFARDTDPEAMEKLIADLVDNQTLLAEQAAAVDRAAIRNFFKSEPGRLAASAKKLNRETIFTVRLSLEEYAALAQFTKTILPTPPEFASDKPFVLMQGSIDCWFDTPDGIILIDYKTGFTAQKDVSDDKNSKYRMQIELYALALKKMTNRDVARKYICMLSAGDYIEII